MASVSGISRLVLSIATIAGQYFPHFAKPILHGLHIPIFALDRMSRLQ